MTLTEFQFFVQQNATQFRGKHHETVAIIADAERRLGKTLPPSMSWLSINWGYSAACGIEALDEAVNVTLRTRETTGLPERYIILNDWQDAGVVFLDTFTPNEFGEYPVYWTGEHNLLRLAHQEAMDQDADVFPDFPAWVISRLEKILS